MQKVLPPVAEKFLNPLLIFILTPYIMNTYGENTYGLWVLLIAISMFSQVWCFGITAWITKPVSESLALNDSVKVKKIVSSSLGFILTVFMVSLLILIAISPFINDEAIKMNFLFLCIASGLFNEIDNLLTNATKGFEFFYYSLIMEIIGRLAWGGGVILGISENNLLLFTFFGFFLKTLIKYIFFSFFVFHSKLIPSFCAYEFKSRFIESRWMLVQLLGGTSLNLFDRLLIPALLGVSKLASYTPCIQLAQLAFSIPAAANQIIMPMFSRFNSKGNFPDGWYATSILASLFSSIPCFFLCLFSQEILTLWITKSFADENYMILRVLAISYALLSSLSVFHYIILGIGESKLAAKINLIAGVMTIIATTFVANFGVAYIAYAKFIYPLIQICYFPCIKKLRERHKVSKDG
ncbi:lipopolysaccharide biosynthesis protein [[Erwinia] mediterraneensis]|uniref:lipopolysaccharide biosynthesis protein n=1 Tax=[Erwinia] mediterraneensis TaxID=2161819 RepID=UPI001030CBFB|nr:oligosaccharide flippase family protein [[Erwinia] mediterraneensis]